MHREEAMCGHKEDAVVCKPGREVSQDTNPAGTLILYFQPPEQWENKYLLSLWYFVWWTEHKTVVAGGGDNFLNSQFKLQTQSINLQ